MTYQAQAEAFLANVFSGRLDDALALCADDVAFISTRPKPSETVRAYGRFVGKEGAKQFFQIFGETLQAGEFNVHATVAGGEHIVMYGDLKHTATATDRPFESDWALVMKFDEAGKLSLYHFYEDTAALEWALGVNG